MDGLSFKTIKGSTVNNITAKIAKAKASGWKLFGETTKEEKADGFFQVMARYNLKKVKNEVRSKVA